MPVLNLVRRVHTPNNARLRDRCTAISASATLRFFAAKRTHVSKVFRHATLCTASVSNRTEERRHAAYDHVRKAALNPVAE
eukprot:scaffold121408_cov30-Tisochrysis_lutea.AAC.7